MLIFHADIQRWSFLDQMDKTNWKAVELQQADKIGFAYHVSTWAYSHTHKYDA